LPISAGTTRDLTTIVIGPVPTDRFGGGDLVAVKAGDALFGVRYGSNAHANDIVIFAEYKRFLGGADIVDAQGNHLATRGIPVYTVLAQRLSRFIEFRHVNASDGFDLTSWDHLFPVPLTQNVPMTALPHVECLGYHDVSGPAIAMGEKYDHLIEGWDFAYPEDELALETHLIVGNYIPERTAVFIHDAFLREHADDGTTMIGNATSL